MYLYLVDVHIEFLFVCCIYLIIEISWMLVVIVFSLGGGSCQLDIQYSLHTLLVLCPCRGRVLLVPFS